MVVNLKKCVIASFRFFIEAKQSAMSDGKSQKPNTPADCFGFEKKPRNDALDEAISQKFSSLRGGTTKQSALWAGLMLLITLFSFSANAKILLPQILGNDMVLQRDKPINIWGFGAVGEKVTVSFAGQTKTTVTDDKGNWIVVLAPLKTSATPQKMTISGSNKIELTNILVGEVWLCSGQSNMEYAMRKLAKIPKPKNEKLGFPSDAVVKAKNTQIRIFLVNRKTLIKPDSVHKSWALAQDSALRNFSAVGYFFAKELQEKLGIPIGIISSAVPGSAIEPWIAEEAFAKEPFFKGQKIGNDPSKFYTPMIEPLTKFALRGVLWYQGETNCFLNETLSYSYKMKALITSWRKAWKNENMPFYYVQIAPFDYSKQKSDKVILTADTEPNFWEAQTQLLRLQNTGMVSTSDLNDNGGDLHPTYKWEVGRRLSLWALAKTYQQKINYSGPIYKSVQYKADKVVIEFDHLANTITNDGKALTGFTLAGADGKFVNATAKLVGRSIEVSSPEIKQPTEVRYNWTENPSGNFYSNGLPALPFRTNNPLTNQFKTN
ncbi:sialate O-acetylesterase [Pedobacter frigiditerrae]|uniref:sialate O-acetylesterase n=1 Tax=Pedobacter frigiditerrae TaxID=2530452 RepID=UPI002931A118|nr:sialate O-acetylesterase [Pedobacter frigiditerrae]